MTEMKIDGHTVKFMRPDGTLATNSVGYSGEDPNGEVMFFEIADNISPTLNGEAKYRRIVIRRVFPVMEIKLPAD